MHTTTGRKVKELKREIDILINQEYFRMLLNVKMMSTKADNEDLSYWDSFCFDDYMCFSSQESIADGNAMIISSQDSTVCEKDIKISSPRSVSNSQTVGILSEEPVIEKHINISELFNINETSVNRGDSTNSKEFDTIEINTTSSVCLMSKLAQPHTNGNRSTHIKSHKSIATQDVFEENVTTVIHSPQEKFLKSDSQEMIISSQESSHTMEISSQESSEMYCLEVNDIMENDLKSSFVIIQPLKENCKITNCKQMLSDLNCFENSASASLRSSEKNCSLGIEERFVALTGKSSIQMHSSSQEMDVSSQNSQKSQIMDTSSQETVIMCEDELSSNCGTQNKFKKLKPNPTGRDSVSSKKLCKSYPQKRKRILKVREREKAVREREIAIMVREKQIAEREAIILAQEKSLKEREQRIFNYETDLLLTKTIEGFP